MHEHAVANPGDPVILKYDSQFGKVGAFAIDGYMHRAISDLPYNAKMLLLFYHTLTQITNLLQPHL